MNEISISYIPVALNLSTQFWIMSRMFSIHQLLSAINKYFHIYFISITESSGKYETMGSLYWSTYAALQTWISYDSGLWPVVMYDTGRSNWLFPLPTSRANIWIPKYVCDFKNIIFRHILLIAILLISFDECYKISLISCYHVGIGLVSGLWHHNTVPFMSKYHVKVTIEIYAKYHSGSRLEWRLQDKYWWSRKCQVLVNILALKTLI